MTAYADHRRPVVPPGFMAYCDIHEVFYVRTLGSGRCPACRMPEPQADGDDGSLLTQRMV